MNPPAIVFICCGQQKDTEEIEIARQICSSLKEHGYEPYIAVEQQCLLGVTDHIFDRIAKSEYFLFIDFRRDELNLGSQNGDENGKYRGSLFSHQELAIASFLGKNVVAFKEQGVSREGISSYIMANASVFSDRKSPPKCVMGKAKEGNWNPRCSRQQDTANYRSSVPNVAGNSNTGIWCFRCKLLLSGHNRHLWVQRRARHRRTRTPPSSWSPDPGCSCRRRRILAGP